jgi:hypothetical protein
LGPVSAKSVSAERLHTAWLWALVPPSLASTKRFVEPREWCKVCH